MSKVDDEIKELWAEIDALTEKLQNEVTRIKAELSRVKKDRPNPRDVNPYDLSLRKKRKSDKPISYRYNDEK
jgi:hypothetical protein